MSGANPKLSKAVAAKRTQSSMGKALRCLARKADLIDYHAGKIREHTTDVARVFGRNTGLQLATQSMTNQNKLMLADMESMPAYTPLGMGLLAGLCDPRAFAAAPAHALQDKSRHALALKNKRSPVIEEEEPVVDLTGEDDQDDVRPAKRRSE
jgi:hypothetical protein